VAFTKKEKLKQVLLFYNFYKLLLVFTYL